MKTQKYPIKSFAAPVLLAAVLGAGAGFAAEPSVPPVPWHVNEADVRIPVTVSLENAWARMPPQVYLADLEPVETKELSFDRKTKSAVVRDVRGREEKEKIIAELKERCRQNNQEYKPEFYRPDLRARGSATFSLKPEYGWLSFWGNSEVAVDGKAVSGAFGGEGDPHPSDHGFSTYKNAGPTIVPLPPDGKTLTIKADAECVRQAGFLTRGPAVAGATFYLPGHDPTSRIPLVCDSSGAGVGCRILWAHPGEPMSILFDCSSGQRQYYVYLVDRSKNPVRLEWAPKAGLIVECRYPNRYDPAVNTADGFQRLWDAAGLVAGKEERSRIWQGFFPFRPFYGTTPDVRYLLRGSQVELSRYTGFFHVPETQKYQFHFKAMPAGYFLMDNQLISQLNYHESDELARKGSREGYKQFEVELEKGIHQMEFRQYGSAERFSALLLWGMPGNESDLEVFGNKFSVWDPVADARADAISHREKELFASFTWQQQHQSWGNYPARDIICLSFAAKLPGKPAGAVFRWRFDDGHTAEGEKVEHHFLSPGMRKVELDVLDSPGGKVIASVSGTVHVHVNWSRPEDIDQGPFPCMDLIAQREEEFAAVTPIEEVVSLYYWSRSQNTLPMLRHIVGSALAQRTDELIKTHPYTLLLEMAESLGSPREAQYAAAEKLLGAVMDRAPAGGRHWRSAALALAEFLVSVRARPESGLELLEKLKRTGPALELTGKWLTAEAKEWHCLTATGEIAGLTEGLNWSKPSDLPVSARTVGGRGAWFAKDIDLPASRNGKELAVELGDNMPGNGVILFNGRRLGWPWQWPDGNIVIPAGMQRAGGKNRFEALFQPADPPEFFGTNRVENYRCVGPAAEKDDPAGCIAADALLMRGEDGKAKEILLALKPGGWPMDEITQLKLASDLRKIPRMAQGNDADLNASFQLLDSWLSRHPMLRTEPGFMLVKMEALAAAGDHARALVLSGQLGRMALNQTQREHWMLVQVKAALKAGKMDAARDVYSELKKVAPYSQATVEAREAITKAVRGK